eukprot:TRINITY_DN3051_c0_g2_i5.p2 TRINITY_DN3051_c0_g2~~TRINITY_DN3051_c0_g2_i5.p2  ORF type:complete len:268 (-),score=16.78 TRINITY_DN3051_c0_g2_i5:2-805(-)
MHVSCSMDSQALANILWAMAKFRWTNSKQIQKIITQSMSTKQPFKAQAISNILWAMASLQHTNFDVLLYFVSLTKKSLHKMKAQEVSNVLWSLQQFRYYDEEILNFIEEVIINRRLQFNSQELANISLAFTEFELQNSQPILESLVEQFECQAFCNIQDYCNFIYSMALLDCPQNLLQPVVNKMVAKFQDQNLENISEVGLSQIQQAQLYSVSKNENKKLILPQHLEKICRNCFQRLSKESATQKKSMLNLGRIVIYFRKKDLFVRF